MRKDRGRGLRGIKKLSGLNNIFYYNLNMEKTPKHTLEIYTPHREDYEEMSSLYNESHKKFLDIYSEEELEASKEDTPETPESLEETALTKKIIAVKENGKILGYSVFRKKNEETVWISSLYVDSNTQGKGVGTKLLIEIESFAKENKCKVIALETHRDAIWAINFYKKNGYQIVNEIINEYPFNHILDKPPIPNRPLLAKTV